MPNTTNHKFWAKAIHIVEASIIYVFLTVILGGMLFICGALIWEANFRTPAKQSEMEMRWDALDNEWDRNMHDPSQRPPDSIANEARLKMLLLEEKEEN
jgi:hypothetical protein